MMPSKIEFLKFPFSPAISVDSRYESLPVGNSGGTGTAVMTRGLWNGSGMTMPRGSRIDAAGALHHFMVRGIERGKVFQSDADRNHFLGRLGEILKDTQTLCYAWALSKGP
jgi:hypothetical protein